MIKVKSTIQVPTSSVEYDEYLPATVRWMTPERATPYYYRLCGENEELIEVGVDPTTYGICRLAVVGISHLDPRLRLPSIGHLAPGLPTLEPHSSWKEPPAYHDVQAEIRTGFQSPNLIVMIGSELDGSSGLVYDAGPAKFAVASDGSLVGIWISLPPNDHASRLNMIAAD